jgi:hypothetical protein
MDLLRQAACDIENDQFICSRGMAERGGGKFEYDD